MKEKGTETDVEKEGELTEAEDDVPSGSKRKVCFLLRQRVICRGT